MTQLRQGILQLRDGRDLGFAEWGPPEATRVIYCHGSPGSRLEIDAVRRVVDDSGLEVRVVAFDRPGFGLSTFQRRRSFLDWPRDVAEAADRLGISSFALIGASGGSPYAMACAIALGERVSRLGIVVGSGPPTSPGMAESPAVREPPRNALLRRIQFGAIAAAFRSGRAESVIDRSIATFAPIDQRAMARPEVRGWFRDVFAQAVRQGGRAAASEAALYWNDWGFDPSEVPVETWLWYSEQDRNVPVEVGRWLHGRIDGSRLSVWPDEGHFTWAFTDRLRDVIAAAAGSAAPVRVANRSARGGRSDGRRR